MNSTTPVFGRTDHGKVLETPDGAGILIVCDSDSEAERLKNSLPKDKFMMESVNSMTEACEAAKSGRFQVILSTPQLQDGTWRRLIDIANHYDLCFEVVLWAADSDFFKREQALDDRAFDVLDATREERRVPEVTKQAVWAACLRGAGPRLGAMYSGKVA